MLCTPTGWTDVVTFLLASYVAHAATVKSAPGKPTLRSYVALATALICPTSGIIRGLRAVLRRARSGSSPLETAKKAGALCTIVRKQDRQPRSGDVVRVFTESAGSRCEKKWREYVKSMAQTVAPASPFLAKAIVLLGNRVVISCYGGPDVGWSRYKEHIGGPEKLQCPKVKLENLQKAGAEERNTLSETDNLGIEITLPRWATLPQRRLFPQILT